MSRIEWGMASLLFRIESDSELGLRDQLRQKLVAAILDGAFAADDRLPSSRQLSRDLKVSRNTVTAAYQQLVDEGYLISRERSGLYVNKDFLSRSHEDTRERQLVVAPSLQGPSLTRPATATEGLKGFRYPADWQSYPYPFIDGRFDRSLFPVSEWREANKLSLSVNDVNQWSTDSGDGDDPQLIEQIRTKVLPLRGIRAGADEILITMGAQQALHILTEVLVGAASVCGVEEPGSPEMRYLANRRGARVKRLAVDEDGVILAPDLDACDVIHVTPSHQRPTGAVLSLERRRELLDRTSSNGTMILEEDYEFDITSGDQVLPALKSMDRRGHVVYVASLSKAFVNSIRLGFIVGPPDIIAAARSFRKLTTGHPPLNNQRTAALFLALGHYNSMTVRLNRIFQDRLFELREGLNYYLQHFLAIPPRLNGTTYWVRGPIGMDVSLLTKDAAERGVIIEPVEHYYALGDEAPNVFRMGITSIPLERVRGGVAALADVLRDMSANDDLKGVERQAGYLSGKEIGEVLSGALLRCMTVYGEPYTIELAVDGSMSGRAGGDDMDTGSWWIDGDLWVRQWRNWAYGEAVGYYITIQGNRISWFNRQHKLVNAAEIAR
jgi:GntR family transcriptional regulator/MocR family aminotransferase